VYKHIPHYFPDRVGAVGGLVGVIGGLGGVVLPILFGVLTARTRLPTTTFAFLFALSLACLVWMMVVVHQITRQAAPRVAEELDERERLALVGAEMAAGGEILFAVRAAEIRARRAKLPSGSE
jgi:NNP family nitrate/nitrite transporter-like MFS transporter